MLETILLYYLAIINLANFLLFGIDKYLAISNSRRVAEKILWLAAIAGGSLGGFMGMEIFRHKRRKISFILIMLIVLLAQSILVFVFYNYLLN